MADTNNFVGKIADLSIVKAVTKEETQCKYLWSESDVVIYFLRRFGCPVCRWISREISSIKQALDENNVKLIGIGPEAVGIDEFVSGKYFAGDLYTDEKREVYQALGFSKFSMMGALGAAVDKETRDLNNKAKSAGLGGNFKGDLKQLGGLLIIKKGGEQLLYFKQEKASEYVKNSAILNKLGINEKTEDNERPDMQCPYTPKGK